MDHWTKTYLSYLGLEENEPSYDYLQSLVETHLERVPFEVAVNITIILLKMLTI